MLDVLQAIVGGLGAILLVAEHGWLRVIGLGLLMLGFVTLAFALFSSWVVVASLLLAATAGLDFVRWRRKRADT